MHPFILFACIAGIYALFTMYYYLGNAVFSCSDTLPTGIGDATAGLIWLNSVDGNLPWWGFTHVSNFPFGERIGLPFHILAQTIYIPFWAISLVVGPVCGYNILTGFGFVFSAMAMFLFIRWLTNKSWIAFIAGFAVAFTPYLQYKTGLHPSYVFQGLFIIAAWLFLAFWRSPSWKKAVGLGIVSALFFYTDPYFILLGGVMAVGLILTATIGTLLKRKNWPSAWHRLRLLLISGLVLFACILPIAYVQIHYKDQIKTLVSSSRSDIKSEAEIYGARPQEYILPNASEPLLGALFGPAYYNRDTHGSNPGETQLSISLTLIVIALGLIAVILRKKLRHEKFKNAWTMQNLSVPFLAFIFSGTALLAVAFSLPPKLGSILTPTDILIHFIDTWRVFARLQVIVNICVVILAAIGLALAVQHLRKKHIRILLIVAVCIGLLFEYQSFFPFRETWSYKTAPQAYHWLKAQSDVTTAAEYPLDEPAKTIYPTYYFSYQILHGKNLINATLPASPQSVLRNALRDLDDPQTVPVLRALGVQVVLVHSKKDPGIVAGLEEVSDVSKTNTFKANEYVWAYRVLPGPTQNYLLAPGEGFNDLRITSITDVGYQTSKLSHMIFIALPNQNNTPQKGVVTIDASSPTGKSQHIRFLQKDTLLWEGDVTENTHITFSVVADQKKPLTIEAPASPTDAVAIFKHISFQGE